MELKLSLKVFLMHFPSFVELFKFNVKLRIQIDSNFSSLIAGWLGAGSWSMSLFATSIIIAFSRRKSTRLVAILGGLVFALGILFTSFATLLHQVALSYCEYNAAVR